MSYYRTTDDYCYTQCTFISNEYVVFDCTVRFTNKEAPAPYDIIQKCNVIVNKKLEVNVDYFKVSSMRTDYYENEVLPIAKKLQKVCIERAKWIFDGFDNTENSTKVHGAVVIA